jgi:hypothetical protein
MECSDVTRKGPLLSGFTGLLGRLCALQANENETSQCLNELLVTTGVDIRGSICELEKKKYRRQFEFRDKIQGVF